jgi:hypothetical protein
MSRDRVRCAVHKRWHSSHAADHCAGKACRYLEAGQACPLAPTVLPQVQIKTVKARMQLQAMRAQARDMLRQAVARGATP